MVMFLILAGHMAVAYLHFLLSWRFYPQRRDNFFVHLFWYLMILSCILHFIYASSYLAFIFHLEGTEYIIIIGYWLLAFMPAFIATLFLGELTQQPQKRNLLATMLSYISKDTKKLFQICFSISILSIFISCFTEFPLDQRSSNFGNLYALGYLAIFGVIWLLMLLSGLRPTRFCSQFQHPTFRYIIIMLLVINILPYMIDFGVGWSSVPIISTVSLSLCFCWYRFRTQFMDVILNQFIRILMMIAMVVVLSDLFKWMHLKSLDTDSQMLILLGFILMSSLLYGWLSKKMSSFWHPPLATLSLIHSELPLLLTRCTDVNSSIEKTEQYLSILFSTHVSINRPLPDSVYSLALEGSPNINIQLNYLRKWMPWFSEALHWVRTAALYLQSHLRVLQTLENDHQQQLKTETLTGLAAKAELHAMRSQIRPHFLFNILNSIHSFVTSNPPKAEQTIEILAALMRGVLQMSEKDEVKLEQELNLVQKYLSIEKIRYGDQFQYEMDVDQDCNGILIPSFSIQPLVENAIKYAVDSQFDPVLIQLKVKKQDNTLLIQVIDNGPGIVNNPSSGLGMASQNIEKRLKNLYGHGGKLTLMDHVKDGVKNGAVALIQIPLHY